MFADKIRKAFYCKKWNVFSRLEPLTIKPVYSVNRNITINSQLIKRSLNRNNYNYKNVTTRHYAILFHLHKENSHAHQVMANLEAYSKSLSPTVSVTEDLKIDNIENLLDKPWISMTNSAIIQNFKLLSYSAHQNSEDLSHLKYQGIFDILAERCPVFNNEELLEFMGLLQLWSNSDLNRNNLSKSLDKTCTDRLPNFTSEQIFLISDYLYKLNAVQYSNFIFHAMRKLDPQNMSPANLVQFAFLMKLRGPVPGINIKKFEYCIEKNIDNFCIEELGIICMAFFKYQTPIKSDNLFLKILRKIQEGIDSVNDITLSCLLKTLRYSADLNVQQGIDVLLKALESQVEDRNLLSLLHTALVQATLLLDNKSLLTKIINRFEKDLENARLKDIERLVFVLYIFNYDPKITPFYKLAAQELQNPRRKGEIARYIKPYVYCIMYMLKADYFPKEVVKNIMDPEFIKKFSDNDINNLDREYLDMSYCLRIDHPEYQGPQLRKDQLKYLLKKFGVFHQEEGKKYQKVDHAGKLMIDLSHHVKLAVGLDSLIHVDYPLPYSNKQYIFMCYDPSSKSFLPPAEPIKQIPLGEIKYAPNDGKQWLVIVPAAHNILTRKSFKPTGMLAMQMRHLERMGYKPALVTYNVWNGMNSQSKKIEFIRHILDDCKAEVSE